MQILFYKIMDRDELLLLDTSKKEKVSVTDPVNL